MSQFKLGIPGVNNIDFIVNQQLTDIRNDHFSTALKNEPNLEYKLRNTLRLLFDGYGVPTMCEDGTFELKHQVYIVYGSKRHGVIGYLKLFELEAGSFEDEIEIHNFSIHDDYKGLGHGARMLDLIIHAFSTQKSIVARCFPKSQAMVNLLVSRGFEVVDISPGGQKLLQLLR